MGKRRSLEKELWAELNTIIKDEKRKKNEDRLYLWTVGVLVALGIAIMLAALAAKLVFLT